MYFAYMHPSDAVTKEYWFNEDCSRLSLCKVQAVFAQHGTKEPFVMVQHL